MSKPIIPALKPEARTHKSGIYQIVNTETGKVYVGSAINISHRWATHRYDLRNNRKTSPRLQNAWNKYGEDAFKFCVLLYCDKQDLAYYEQLAIDFYQSADRSKGYNICPLAWTNVGRKMSAESRAKMSAAKKGKPSPTRGVKKTEEQLAKYRGRPVSEETRAKLRAANTGDKHPKFGTKHSAETRAKISKANKGKVRSKAHRLNTSRVSAMFSPEQVSEIFRLRAAGLTRIKIAAIFNCNRRTIENVLKGKRLAYTKREGS